MKKIILTLMMSAAVMASYAQADHEDVMNYRRSSLYSLMVNHTDVSGSAFIPCIIQKKQ